MMAKGNIDGVFGALFRSGTEMQAKRLDAITLLIGDPVSMRMADLRMRSPFTRSTTNSLQQTATREALKYDAWIGIDPRHLASVASVFGAASTPGLSGLGNLLGLSAGLYLRDQIRLEASLDTPSAELAERMLAAFEKSRQPDQVWVSTEGAKVRFIQIVEAKSLKSLPGFDPQLMGSKIAPLIQSLAASNVGAQSANAGPSKPTGAIVIQGLSAK